MYKRKFYKIRAEIILDYRILELQQKLYIRKECVDKDWQYREKKVFSANPWLAKLVIMYYRYIYIHIHKKRACYGVFRGNEIHKYLKNTYFRRKPFIRMQRLSYSRA